MRTTDDIMLKAIPRSSHRECSIKKGVLKNVAKVTGNTCVGVSFLIKLQVLGVRTDTVVFV